MKTRHGEPSLWRAMILYVTAIVVAIALLSSLAFVPYINGILRENTRIAFMDLTDKLAQSVATLIGETELLGRSMARDTVLSGAMLNAEGQYPLSRQYDDYFQLRAFLSNHLDHRQVAQFRLIFRHSAFYTREGVSLLSAQSEAARALGLDEARLASDRLEWGVWDGTIRYVQPVLNYKYAAMPIGLVVLELSDAYLETIFTNIQSLEDACYTLRLDDAAVRVYGTEDTVDAALARTIGLGRGFSLSIAAPDMRHGVRIWQSLLTIAPWILGGCALVLFVFARFAKRFYRSIASLAGAISTIDVLGDTQVGPARYRELGVIVVHFNRLLMQVRATFAEAIQAQEKERALSLRMLESQINPHFLYNSLDAINWLAYQQGAEDVAAMARSLGLFYRDALAMDSNENTLAEELAHVQTYLDILRCRLEGELSLGVDVPEEHKNAAVPRLSLQPIVENAVQHGVLQKPGGQGSIRLRTYVESNQLIISVWDDGPGMPEETCLAYTRKLSIWPPEEMHGLINIHQRTQLLYGKGYGITLHSQYGQFMEVRLHVPAMQNAAYI